ncbi:hypothetical protein E4T42_08523 [Aureobasidium subglaciale]|nr:hypothetical protein E4T42_08523 [Aureobasidium subglaciale]
MTGCLQPNYFYLPFEIRPQIDHTDLAITQGGSPSWQLLPSYPSPPMSSPPSPQRKGSDIPPSQATAFQNFTLSTTTTSINPPTTSSDFTITFVPTDVSASTLQSIPRSLDLVQVAGSSDAPRTYSSSSAESIALIRRTGSISSVSNVLDHLPTAGPSARQPSPNTGRGGRRAKSHVANACNNCKRAHLSCDVERPCSRCTATGKSDTCRDVPHKKRGRPRLRDEGQFRLQRSNVETEVEDSPVLGSPSARPMARPGHRKTASLRTLAAFAAEQSHQPLTARDSSTPMYGQDYSLASRPPTGYHPPTRHPRLAPSPEVPIAFLDTDFVVLKANATFQRLFSWLQEIRGMRLSDIAKPVEGDSFQSARNQLREEREIREPAYLPPILQPRLDPVSGIGITDHDVEEVTRGFTDHQFAWTFRLGGGIDQMLPVRMRLAKSSVYFVTLFLPPLPPQMPEQVIAPQSPPIMFPTRIIAPPPTSFQSSPRMVHQQPGISEPPSTYYTFPTADAVPQSYPLPRRYSFGEQPPYPYTMHYQSQPSFQQSSQQMLPPPSTIPQASDQRPGTASSNSSGIMTQPIFLQPPMNTRSNRPRSDTMDSLGRQIQTRLRADSGATVPPAIHSSPVQQRHAPERANSEDEYEAGERSGSPRKRRRLDINEMLQR